MKVWTLRSMLWAIVIMVSCGVMLGAASSVSAQCQDQYCSYSSSRGCFQCVATAGFYCSPGKGRYCPLSCESGRCPAAATPLLATDMALNSLAAPTVPSTAACDASVDQIKKNQTLPVTEPDDSTGFVPAWQDSSPAVVTQFTVSVENGSFVISEVALKNTTDVPVAEYRLGWVVVYADAQKKPEVHSGEFMQLSKAANGMATSDKAVPVSIGKGVKALSLFVMDSKSQDGRVFHEDEDKVAQSQYQRVWTPTKN
jgi:hypothetical protein